MADKNILMHPIINGEEDVSINLFPKTTKENVVDFSVESGDVNSGSASAGQVLVADGSGGASFETLDIRTYREFPSAWLPYTRETTAAFCAAVNSDATAVGGMAYLGELRCSDLPSPLVNVEAIVEIINDTNLQKKVIHITISSGNTAPYRWEYTYWNNKTVKGWVGFQPALTAGDNITINTNTNTISAIVPVQVQSNWSEADTDSAAYIQNKPTLGTSAAKDYITSVTDGSADLVTSGAVYTAISDLPEPMVFKGSVGTSGTVEWANLPAASSANVGYTYKVITAHDTTPICSVGDTIISSGSEWVVIPSGDEPSGTVTSVNVSVPNGLTVSGVPITSSGTIAITYAEGYSIPSTTDQQAWSAKQNAIDSIDANGLYINPEDYDGTSALQYTYSSTGGVYTAAVTTGSYTGLTEIKVPKYVKHNNIWHEVTEIGAGVFNGCAALESITIPFVGGNKNATVASASTLFGYIFGTDSYTGGTSTEQYYGDGPSDKATYYIPTALHSVTVTGGSILYGAFRSCSLLTSLTIPDSVTTIWDRAFYGCSGLTSITIPDSVTSIERWAFYGCSGLTSVTIPNSVTSIGDYAFRECISLTSVNIPDSVTSLGNYAFWRCSGLTSITIPNSVTSIGSGVFENCSGLTSVTIPESVTSILNYAFSGCSGLTSVTIPDSVTSIGDYAFNSCALLTTIIFNQKIVHEISGSPWGAPNNPTITYNGLKSEAAVSGGTTTSLVTTGEKYIWNSAEANTIETVKFNDVALTPDANRAVNIEIDTIDANGLYIDPEDFDGTSALQYTYSSTGGVYTAAVTTGSYTGLTEIKVPKYVKHNNIWHEVTEIGAGVFNGCAALESITIPFVGGNKNATVASASTLFGYIFGTDSYTGGTSTEQYYGDESSDTATYYIPTALHSVTVTGGSILYGAFSDCSGLTSITIPDGVTSIGIYAFGDCSGLTSIVIPDSVTSIEQWAFEGCSELTSITIPDGVTSIGPGAFLRCSELTSITIPEGVTSIGYNAFNNCVTLTSITIPDSVTSIGYNAFHNCASLTTITFNQKIVHEVAGSPWGATGATITYNGRLSPSIITVADITALTSDQLNSLECGYIVNQKSSGVSRSYVVSYKDTTLGELSLVYTDHTGLQEVHYNTVSDNWAYDQTYSVSFGS